MKRLLLALFFSATFTASFSQAGFTFAEVGTQWYYQYSCYECDPGITTDGYYHITSQKDTLISGKILQKLVGNLNKRSDSNFTTYDWGPYYFYTSNDSVYFLRDKGLTFLYDFKAKPGDFWEVLAYRDNALGCSGEYDINDTASILVNGARLKVVKEVGDYRDIIENIGPLTYLFPSCHNIRNDNIYGLRCFIAPNGFHYSPDWFKGQCDEIKTGIQRVEKQQAVQLVSTLVSNELSLIFNQNNNNLQLLSISEATGKIVQQITLPINTQKTSINVTHLSTGYYQATINGYYIGRFYKQ